MKFELGPGLKCDLAVLMESRLLIQAQSGGGKSRTLRRILEQTHGKVQQIVIDPEGEFSTLREKFDYVLAAPSGGDALAHPRTAGMLSERLLQLGVSAVVDLYELKPALRIEFVKLFFEALVNAPKALRHPVIVAVDEAQMFAPEGAKAESAAAVADLAVRGRKRGICLIAAVARLSEFDKAVAAPLQNKLIGITSLDLDMKRAAQELGFDKAGMLALRDLERMQFWGFGPALVRAPTLVTIGEHVTTHLRPGARLTAVVPPPTEKIKALLPQLADLPQEAEQRQKTMDDLKRELASVRRELTQAQRATGQVDQAALRDAQQAAATDLRTARAETAQLQAHVGKLTQAVERLMKIIVEIHTQDFFKDAGDQVDRAQIQKAVEAATEKAVTLLEQSLAGRRAAFERWRKQGEQLLAEVGRLLKQDVKVSVAVRHNAPFTVTPVPEKPRVPRVAPSVNGDTASLATAQRKILNALAFLEQVGFPTPDKTQVSVFAALSPTAGHTTNMFGGLRTGGLIEYPGNGRVTLTDAGRAAADPGDVPQTAEEMHQLLFNRVAGAQRKILKVLIEAYPQPLDKREVSERAGLSPTAGHTTNMFGGLRTMGVIDYPTPGTVVALPVLFLEAAR